mgnify:FL=1
MKLMNAHRGPDEGKSVPDFCGLRNIRQNNHLQFIQAVPARRIVGEEHGAPVTSAGHFVTSRPVYPQLFGVE